MFFFVKVLIERSPKYHLRGKNYTGFLVETFFMSMTYFYMHIAGAHLLLVL